jgi:hypothetical protein
MLLLAPWSLLWVVLVWGGPLVYVSFVSFVPQSSLARPLPCVPRLVGLNWPLVLAPGPFKWYAVVWLLFWVVYI